MGGELAEMVVEAQAWAGFKEAAFKEATGGRLEMATRRAGPRRHVHMTLRLAVRDATGRAERDCNIAHFDAILMRLMASCTIWHN